MILELLAAISVQVGVGYGVSTSSTEIYEYRPAYNLELEVGPRQKNYYAWISGSNGSWKILGQSLTDVNTVSAGVGYNLDFTDKISLFVEGGYAVPKLSGTNELVQQEVVYTYLVGRHNVENRPVPVPIGPPYDTSTYSTEIDIRSSAVINVGVEFEITENFSTEIGFKFLQPKTNVKLFNEEWVAEGGGYWEENKTLNMNSIGLTFNWTF